MKLILLLATLLAAVVNVNAAAPYATKQAFPNLATDLTAISGASMDDSQNLYVIGIKGEFGQEGWQLKSFNRNGSPNFQVAVPNDAETLFDRPNSVLVTDNKVIVLTNGNKKDNKGDQADLHFFSKTGQLESGKVNLLGMPFVESGETKSSITALSIIESAVQNRVYVIGSAIMNIDTAAYGYMVYCIDTASKAVVWQNTLWDSVNHPDGGSVEVALEVGSYLWVGGFQGVYRFDIATGTMDATKIASFPVYTLGLVGPNVLISGYKNAKSVNANSLALVFETQEYGFLQPGSDENTLWFARTLAESGRPYEWDVEAGVLYPDGSKKWSKTFDSGNDLGDSMVGWVQHPQKTALRMLTNGQSRETYRWFLWFTRERVVDNLRMLTFDDTTKTISSQLLAKEVRYATEFVSSGTISWGISASGEAVKFTHAAPSANDSSGEFVTESNVSEDESEIKYTNGAYASIVGAVAAFVGMTAFVIVRRTRQSAEDATPLNVEGTVSSANPMFNEV